MNDTNKEKLKQAIEALDEANRLLDEAYREHLKTSYSIKFDNLVDKNGDTIEIDLGEEYKPICVELMKVGRRARAFGKRFKAATEHRAQLDEIGHLAHESGSKVQRAFGNG